MLYPIHEKIQHLLRKRKIRKKDLASHLGIAPQTMTDICQGRSSVTLKHLRGLVSFFGIRADYWIDDFRLEPEPRDYFKVLPDEDLQQMEALGIIGSPNWKSTLARVQYFIGMNRELWESHFGKVSVEDSRLLGLPLVEKDLLSSEDLQKNPFPFLEEDRGNAENAEG